jgi:crossover junction endodeoxyribonuclease RuvC
MRVIGIDPGSSVTGYGIVEIEGGRVCHLDNGGIIPRSNLPYSKRLDHIFTNLSKLIAEHKPEMAVIENVFFAKNARSSLVLGQARGVAVLAAVRAGLEIAEYAPTEVKLAVVGTGRATKHQVQNMVKAILKLDEVAMEDASDALAIAICHCHAHKLKDRIAKSLKSKR